MWFCFCNVKSPETRGWGFSSAVEHLPSKRKAVGSVPSSEKKKKRVQKLGPRRQS
ncbi:calcium and integrin binding 1 (calmyrin), isoform CRA_c [Rattus norvegicus]|uniref:Calcium and integrin binding 1 (Calmyrin), isoform CRA_c n=1 Tax=Rattus norvegicus TaxID=10116 RepID=A6JC89_RAT|nr:calcium and integrin binding 1 (calmyrin), isoform CRA_c [Rattus norvegicus]